MRLIGSAFHPLRLPLMLALAVALMSPASGFADAIASPAGDPSAGSPKSTEFMHARYYSSDFGRFLSVDPVGGDVGSSQSWNRYLYVLNNPTAFVDPSGEEVKLVMEDRDRDQFISELEQKTGFDLDLSDGSLVVRGTLTDAEGNQIGSEAAREILAAFINAESVFTVEGVNADPNVWGAQHVRGTDTVTLDFTDIAMIQPGANGSSTFDSAMIGLHELVHTVGLRDPGPITLSNYPDATGETVDVMNVVRRQLGLPQRSQYAPVPSSSGRAYIPFEHGPLYLPPRTYGGSITVN